eukprot:3940394-Pleurochrysis_carterae.AAC.1
MHVVGHRMQVSARTSVRTVQLRVYVRAQMRACARARARRCACHCACCGGPICGASAYARAWAAAPRRDGTIGIGEPLTRIASGELRQLRDGELDLRRGRHRQTDRQTDWR